MTAVLKNAPETSSPAAASVPPASVPSRVWLAVGLLVALADAALFRSQGYAGPAVFLAVAPFLLWLGTTESPNRGWTLTFAVLSLLLALRLAWFGDPLQAVLAVGLIFAVSAALTRQTPTLPTVLVHASQSVPAGLQALKVATSQLGRRLPAVSKMRWLSIALPLAALVAFGTLFILANPDVVDFLGRRTQLVMQWLHDWIVRTTLNPAELVFCLAIGWISLGLLRPLIRIAGTEPAPNTASAPTTPDTASLYPAFRNTLLTVIVLFAAYLVFEFRTLWFREFPQGFYYAGYAHRGAAWLTVALAAATLTLSLVFRGSLLDDPRIGRLQRLAWVWSGLNVLLSLAVYNRLGIYVGFNGLTRMRIVGFFGISAVVAGFALVVIKIAQRHEFSWLIRRQVGALAMAFYLFALTPVDWVVVSYNVQQVQRGQEPAVMQIGVQPIDAEGALALLPLLESENPAIREGVAALLALKYEALERRVARANAKGWSATQLVDRIALARLEPLKRHWAHFYARDRQWLYAKIDEFYDYAYQWY